MSDLSKIFDRDQERFDSRMLHFRASYRPAVVFLNCPVRASLDVLGRKWTFLVLYSMGFMKINRFNQILKYIPEITRSLLARRLAQLERAGYVQKKVKNGRHTVVWELTKKGKDTIPIIIGIIGHSALWRPEELFADRSPRDLEEIFPFLMAKVPTKLVGPRKA